MAPANEEEKGERLLACVAENKSPNLAMLALDTSKSKIEKGFSKKSYGRLHTHPEKSKSLQMKSISKMLQVDDRTNGVELSNEITTAPAKSQDIKRSTKNTHHQVAGKARQELEDPFVDDKLVVGFVIEDSCDEA